MFFNSAEFLVFLPVVLGVYYVLSRRVQNAWLVLSSYFFYGWWNWRFCGLLTPVGRKRFPHILASSLLDKGQPWGWPCTLPI